ncbi:Dihydrofolate reductase [Marinobacterium lacunae]|uniref:Dihydrofolate reductase n=1 Tax=Marinobacterium lacunae TaxID=1232683 RepID=A0A081FY37_9GAMM|nr:dihydrofolate reductase [Marinobacterium lacunae]KEA63442.1 Dihydrofolate reductase [Marinobacterium lacunae]MBR9885806.1 dihydrofolate reductase [Oceanospirillales bacterium]
MRVAVIVAQAENRVIGSENRLPWHLPEDLRYFKQVTMGKPIIMGRKTFESIGRPLPGRCNIVITRDASWSAPGVVVVSSPEEAIERASAQAEIDGVDEAMVIGGAEIYRQMLPLSDRLYLTQVHADVEGDARFPEFDLAQWRELGREDFAASENNPYNYSFIVLQRAAQEGVRG